MFKFELGFILLSLSCNVILGNNYNLNSHLRQKRSLIYPPTTPTRLQFIGGIGIPVENLAYESVTSGYVLKAEYFIPTKAEHLHYDYLKPQTVHRRSVGNSTDNEYQIEQVTRSERKLDRQNDLSRYRWTIYKGIEQLVNRMGLMGRPCMLRAICEVARTPFHYESGLLSELFHIVMTPSTSVDAISTHLDNEYFHAEVLGKSGAPCEKIFKDCPQSILSQISTVYEIMF